MNQTLSREDASTRPWEEALDQLDVQKDQGLSAREVEQRRARFGSNELREKEPASVWNVLFSQLLDPIVGLLAAAAIVSFVLGQHVDALAVGVVIVINTAIGFFTEWKAVRSMEALEKLGGLDAKVRREGEVYEIDASELVPGDIVILDAGDLVSADIRLFDASRLQVNESALTGESVPVAKETDALTESSDLAETRNMVFKGTSVTRGTGAGVVVRTGMDTEIGHVSELVVSAEEEVTPLEKRLDKLAHMLIWAVIGLAAIIGGIGLLSGQEPRLIIEISVALAIAAIPEGLPIIATVALARGVWQMAQRNALINQLSSVETLGATSVICTDKTGTLTENQMTVTRFTLSDETITVSGEGLNREGTFSIDDETIAPEQHKPLETVLRVGALCSNAELGPEGTDPVGDPLEVALLVAASKAGMQRNEMLARYPEVREDAFDSATKRMATFHEQPDQDGYFVAVKGAAEEVLDACTHVLTANGPKPVGDDHYEHWENVNQQLAEDGLRVIALACRTADDSDATPYQDLTFVGFAGMVDPPREDVKPAIEACHEAGIRIVMVTGDQPATAKNVARALDLTENDAEALRGDELAAPDTLSDEQRNRLIDTPIFARVSPEEKLNLISLHQNAGQIVAMTGDGVNDAPALKKADIGVAMGERGTQVAQQAARMVLQDDAFGTIVNAIEYGRAIFDNIRKFTIYLLSGNIGQIFIIGVASGLGSSLPLLPLQILYLNIVNDVFPALALGVGEGDKNIMKRPPRPASEPIIARRHWRRMIVYGIIIAAPVLAAFWLAQSWLGKPYESAVTIAFLGVSISRLWHVFNVRTPGSGIFDNEISRNPYIWGAFGVCLTLLLGAVYLPGLSSTLQLVHPGLDGWLLVLATSVVPWILGQTYKSTMTRD